MQKNSKKIQKISKEKFKRNNIIILDFICRENYLPPFKTEEVEFKSFSQIYLNWLFNHQGGIELYSQYIRNVGEEELNKIYSNYGVKDAEDKITIKNFFINFASFFANLKITENRNNSDSTNNIENINNTNMNKGLFSEPDLATNLFGNFNYNIRDEEEELSIGSIKDFCSEERINNDDDKEKEYMRENDNIEENNKMIVSSDSSNSSMDNIQRHCNINIYKNNKIMKYNNPFCPANSQNEEFFINNIDKKLENKFNQIYPDINTFEYDYENKMKISASESIYFINKERNENFDENKNEKKED